MEHTALIILYFITGVAGQGKYLGSHQITKAEAEVVNTHASTGRCVINDNYGLAN